MSDAARAELRRRYASGELAAGVALLEELGRAGELRPGAVALAAHLGEPAAATLRPGAAGPGSFEAWVNGLEAHGLEAWSRVGLAALRSLLPLWSHPERGPGDRRLAREVELLEAYVHDPSPVTAGAVGCTPSEASDLALLGGEAVDVWRALGSLVRSGRFEPLREALDRASLRRGEGRVREAVQREVCAWLLPDPAWSHRGG
ncbi:MAG: hypothetical protein KDD82_15020 [Planctomycetes bacterium]|nr:hypothetical protein [Planctomycetota bacterium]